jgi:HK97 family phage prohead protease
MPNDAAILPLVRRFAEERAFIPGAMVELRTADGQPARIDGHAALYDKWSQDLGGFRERIMPGAFAGAMEDGADVRALFNHDPNFLLGRTTAKTLELSDEDVGLRYIAMPPDTQTVRDLVLVPLARRDLTQSSFQFIALEDEWRDTKEGMERDLISAELFDVSPVTFPAYPQTDVGLRSIVAAELGIRPSDLTSLLVRALRGDASTETHMRDVTQLVTTHAKPLSPDAAWNQRMKGLLTR